MRNHATPFLLLALVSGAACQQQPISFEPHPVSVNAPTERYDLVIPPNLEVRNADYSATALGEVGGSEGATSSRVEIRNFVKIYAVDRTTGDQFVLVYEDIAHRKEPIQIIRLVQAAADSGSIRKP
jgi:hypothetical protein